MSCELGTFSDQVTTNSQNPTHSLVECLALVKAREVEGGTPTVLVQLRRTVIVALETTSMCMSTVAIATWSNCCGLTVDNVSIVGETVISVLLLVLGRVGFPELGVVGDARVDAAVGELAVSLVGGTVGCPATREQS